MNDLIEKPVKGRCGPATVMGSKAMSMPLRRNCLGKVWQHDDPEPGELPVEQSPFDLRVTGRGLIAAIARF